MACPTRAVLTSPVRLTGVRLTFTGQGYRLVTRFLLTWFRYMVELGSRCLQTCCGNRFSEHSCTRSIPRKLLEITVSSLTSLYLIVFRDNPAAKTQREINDDCYKATSSDSHYGHIDNKQHHTNVLCDSCVVYDTQGLHIKNQLCRISQSCQNVTTDSREQNTENQQCCVNEDCYIVLTSDQQEKDTDNQLHIPLLPFVSQWSIGGQQTYAKSPYPSLSHVAHVRKNMAPTDLQEQEIERQPFHNDKAYNSQRPYTENQPLHTNEAYTNSQRPYFENQQYHESQACHNLTITVSQAQGVENQQHCTSEACDKLTTTDSQGHEATKQCCNSEACRKITTRNSQDPENQQCRISEASIYFATTNSRSTCTENQRWVNLITESHSLRGAKSAGTVLMCWRVGSRKGNILRSAFYIGGHDNNCNNNNGEISDNNTNINMKGKDSNTNCNKVEKSKNNYTNKSDVNDYNNNRREDDDCKKGHNNGNNNNNSNNKSNKEGVSNNNNEEVNENNKEEINNNSNKGEVRSNNNKGEVNNNNKGEVNNNNNNSDNIKEEDNDTDCHTDERLFTASYHPYQTNACIQTDNFVCDIMNTPAVLTSVDRVYHLTSSPTTCSSGIEPCRLDTHLPTSKVHSSNDHKQDNHANNSSAANFLTSSSDTDNCADLLSRAMSIAGVGDNDIVYNVDFLTEYPAKVDDSNPGFLDEADRFVETIFAESNRLRCAETGHADFAMSHTCTGHTLHCQVTPDTSKRDEDDATGLQLSTYHGTIDLLHNSRGFPRSGWGNQPDAFIPRPDYPHPLSYSTRYSSDSFSYHLDSCSRPPESFSHLHDSFSHNQDSNVCDIDFFSRDVGSYPSESRYHGPNSFSYLPDSFSHDPNSFSNRLDSFHHLPDSTSNQFDSFRHLPDSTSHGLDSFSHVSFSHYSTSNRYDSYRHLPDSTSHGLDSFSHVSNSTSNQFDSFHHLPDSSSHGLDSFSHLPVSTSYGFDSCCHLPDSTSHGFDSFSHLPDSCSNLPDKHCRLLDSCSNLPDKHCRLLDTCSNLPDKHCRLLDSCSNLTDPFSHLRDPSLHRSVSFSLDPDSYNGHDDFWCHRPDVSHPPDSWRPGTDGPSDRTERNISGCLNYESLDPGRSKCKATVSSEQSCLNEVITTSLQILNHSDPVNDKCWQDANAVLQLENTSAVESKPLSFIQDTLVVNEVLEMLPDTELWSDQQTAPHCSEAEEGKSRRQLDSLTKLEHSKDSVEDSLTQSSDIGLREAGGTSFLKTDELFRVDNKQSHARSNTSGTRLFTLTSFKHGQTISSLTRSVPFKARSLVPINECLQKRRSRTGVTTRTSLYSSKQKDCHYSSNKNTRETLNPSLRVPLTSTKLKKETVQLDSCMPQTQVHSSLASYDVPSVDPPSLGQSPKGSVRNSRNNRNSASNPSSDVVRMRQGSEIVDKRASRKRKCTPELTKEELTESDIAQTKLIRPKLTAPKLKTQANETTNINEKTPRHGNSKNCISRCPLPAGHASLLTLQKSQKGKAAGPTETYTDTTDVRGKLSQALVRKQRVPQKNLILEGCQDRLVLSADVQQKSKTTAGLATKDTVIKTDSVKGSGAGVRGKASWVTRFLETRDASVTSFTQQMAVYSPGLLKGRRSNDLLDKFQPRNKIATLIPKQVQFFKTVQLRQVRQQRKKLIEENADQKVIPLKTATETDCNNHANYETPKPISTSRSKGNPKSLARQDFAESHEVNTKQRDKYVHFAKDLNRQNHQNLEPHEKKVYLPSIHREKTVSFRESPSGPVERPQLNRMDLQCESSGSTLFSIILEEFRTSKGNTSFEKESLPSAQKNSSAGTSQERNFLPNINPKCVQNVESPVMGKTALNLKQQGLAAKTPVKNDQCITNVNNSRKMRASQHALMNCSIKKTVTKTNMEECSRRTESPTGNVANGQLVDIFHHSNNQADKCQLKATLRPTLSRVKTICRPGADRKSSTKLESGRPDTDNKEIGQSESNSQSRRNANIKSSVQTSSSNESARKCAAVSRHTRSDLSTTKCPVPKRVRPPLKPEIAKIVDRLASRPPSTDSKLMMMIGNWEREYGQPLNINQQLECLVEAKLQRHKPNQRRTTRHQRKTGHSFRVPCPPSQHNDVCDKAVRAGQPLSISLDSLRFDSPGLSDSNSSQGPGAAGEDDGEDVAVSLQ